VEGGAELRAVVGVGTVALGLELEGLGLTWLEREVDVEPWQREAVGGVLGRLDAGDVPDDAVALLDLDVLGSSS
jgi:hypothetical protein